VVGEVAYADDATWRTYALGTEFDRGRIHRAFNLTLTVPSIPLIFLPHFPFTIYHPQKVVYYKTSRFPLLFFSPG
jgi:hypothetical protein